MILTGQGTYLFLLVASLVGLYLLDCRHNLAIRVSPIRSLLAMAPAYIWLLIWDVLGIQNGIFFTGENSLLVGIELAPELPIEELLFLALLCYSTLIAFTWISKLRSK